VTGRMLVSTMKSAFTIISGIRPLSKSPAREKLKGWVFVTGAPWRVLLERV
jgi:hypothetical protein